MYLTAFRSLFARFPLSLCSLTVRWSRRVNRKNNYSMFRDRFRALLAVRTRNRQIG